MGIRGIDRDHPAKHRWDTESVFAKSCSCLLLGMHARLRGAGPAFRDPRLPYGRRGRGPLGGTASITLGDMDTHSWRTLWWSLFVVWIASAILDVRHIHAGLITSYGADLALPAWLYIATRSLDNPQRKSWLKRILGRSPELAASVLFLASAITEASQFYWPAGIFPGVFDVFDIIAYGIGIMACYILDKRSLRRSVKVSE